MTRKVVFSCSSQHILSLMNLTNEVPFCSSMGGDGKIHHPRSCHDGKEEVIHPPDTSVAYSFTVDMPMAMQIIIRWRCASVSVPAGNLHCMPFSSLCYLRCGRKQQGIPGPNLALRWKV